MRTKTEFIILVPQENDQVQTFNGKTFVCFNVVTDTGAIIDYYDAINIKGSVRFDVIQYNCKCCARFFAGRGSRDGKIYYDRENHSVYDKEV